MWPADGRGVLLLPSGRTVRGRPLQDGPLPQRGLYLLGHEPDAVPWPHRWVRWPDFRLPAGPLGEELVDLLEHAGRERVEVACGGGRGRTGTALACLAVLDGVPPSQAVAWVRDGYDRRAVETPWRRRYVTRFR
ncbi:MAG: protein phosphatase [Frankiales bacterium]|nr:protein phosphatase [Frankiales bacterium]